MTGIAGVKPPPWFWAIVIGAVIWNLLGVAAYIVDVTRGEDALAALPEAERALYASTPVWATAAYAIAVFSGLGGAVLLALRRKYAVQAFALSLAGVVLQMLHAFVLSETLAVLGLTSIIMPAFIVIIAAALIWFSVYAKRQAWLN